MAAIIRVKRRLDEDPAENLIIQYKRSRTDGSEADETAKLCLSLVTTVKSKDAALSRPLRKDKEQLQTSYKSHNSKRLAQTRAENTALRRASRYKIVNSRRAASGDLNEAGAESPAPEESKESAEPRAVSGLDQAASSDSDTRTSATPSSPESAGAGCSEGYEPVIHDVEVDGESVEDVLPGMESPSGITLNGQPLISRPTFSTAESNYVYDLYYTHQSDPSYTFRDIENILSIEAFHDTMLTDADRTQECEEVYDDEDNSNDEDNWRNEYPDRDPDAPSSSGDSDVEHEDDFLEGKESCAYRSSVKDNMLVEALGSKLQIFGSDDSSRSGDESDEEDAYKDDDDNPYRLVSSYKAPIRPMKEDLGVKDGDWDDNYF